MSTYLIGSGGEIMGCQAHERHRQSPANQRHKVRGLLIPLTRNFSIESHFSPASAGFFERGFISKVARNTRRQKFSGVVRAPSGTSFIYELASAGHDRGVKTDPWESIPAFVTLI